MFIIRGRTYERGTKARLSFPSGPYAPANMADSMEEANVGGKTQEMARLLRCTALISYAKFSQIIEVLRDFHRLFGTRNSRTTGILLIIDHVYRSVWPAREAKPRFGAALVRSAHDCSLIVSLLVICSAQVSTLACLVIISSYLPIVSTNRKIYHSQWVLC